MSSSYSGTDAWCNEITLPSDGDDADAASVNVPLEGLADRTTYLKGQVESAIAELSPYRLMELMHSSSDTTGVEDDSTATDWGTGDVGLATVTVANNDRVEVRITFHGHCAAESAAYRLAYKIGTGSMTAIEGARAEMPIAHSASILSYALNGAFTAGSAGTCTIYIQQKTGNGANAVSFRGPYHATVERWRAVA